MAEGQSGAHPTEYTYKNLLSFTDGILFTLGYWSSIRWANAFACLQSNYCIPSRFLVIHISLQWTSNSSLCMAFTNILTICG